jgi:hypothetical protein
VLRRRPDAPTPTDPLDLELLEAVDEGVPWRGLLRSASCPPEEAEGRLMRMLMTGVLEGEPGETGPSSTPRPAPPLPSQRPSVAPTPRPSIAAPGSAGAQAAGESLLRELMRRTTGTGFAPVGADPVRQSTVPPTPGTSGINNRVSTTPPRAQSMPPEARTSSAPPVSRSVPAPSEPARTASSTPQPSRPASMTPTPTPSVPRITQSDSPGPYGASSSSLPPSRPSSPGALSVSSALLPLIEEFSHGQGIQRWAAARLREALLEELAGNLTQAVAILQVVMAQIEEPRVRAERDRMQNQLKAAASGVHRSRALSAERDSRPREAVEHWSKVLDANPQDVEAALHAGLCALNAGDLKQAGLFAKRAVELAPNNINAHKILHRFFRKAGMERSAKREEEIIAKLKKA